PQEVHLEEAILAVEEAEGPGHVYPALPADRGYAQKVALHAYRGGEPGQAPLARGLGQAPAQEDVRSHDRAREDGEHDQDGAEDEANGPTPAAGRRAVRLRHVT